MARADYIETILSENGFQLIDASYVGRGSRDIWECPYRDCEIETDYNQDEFVEIKIYNAYGLLVYRKSVSTLEQVNEVLLKFQKDLINE